LKTEQECCGGFVINEKGSEISITHPDGEWFVLSSSDSGGYTEALDEFILTNKPGGKAFEIVMSPDVGTYSLVTLSYGKTSVSALVVADPKFKTKSAGNRMYSIAVVLMIDAKLPQATLARAAITSTEAITCALQQLLIRHPVSGDLACGSDSVCIAVLSNAERGITLHSAGKHSKLGELIGKSVLEAALSSMGKNGVTPESQADVFKRLECFGITKASCREYLLNRELEPGSGFDSQLDNISKDPVILSYVSSVLHIADGMTWGLIPMEEGYEIGYRIISETLSKSATKSGDLATDIMSAISIKAFRTD
jgi:hypothetical protein